MGRNLLSDDGSNHHHQNGVKTTSKKPKQKETTALVVDVDAAVQNIDKRENPNGIELTPSNPSKKRKIDQPPSPPWKLPKADTPSSYIDPNGRKRSARTNGLPSNSSPLQAPIRKTRSTIPKSTEKTVKTITRGLSTPKTCHVAVNTPASKSQLHRATSTLVNSQSRKKSSLSSSKATSSAQRTASKVKQKPNITEKTPSKQNGTKKQSPGSRRSTRHPFGPKLSDRISDGDAHSDRDDPQVSKDPYDFVEDEDGDEEEEEDDDDDDDDEDEREAAEGDENDDFDRRISLRLTFSRKLKPPIACNINNLPPPRKYSSLREYFEQEPVNSEELSSLEEQVLVEASRRFKLEQAIEEGILRPETLNATKFQTHQGLSKIQPQWGHIDHLLQHAIRFNKLLKMERLSHMKIAKTIALEAAKEARRRMPKTQEEIEREEFFENNMKYKNTIASLKIRMKLAEKAAQDVIRQRFLEDERQAGRETLKKMLHHSSTLLSARIKSRDEPTEQDADQSDLGQSESNTSSNDENESDDSERGSNMSENSDSEDSSNSVISNDDDDLSPDQLRQKYAINVEESAKYEEQDNVDDISMPDVDDKYDLESSKNDGKENLTLGSDSDESEQDVSMDSEDEFDYEEQDSDEADEDSEADTTGLLGFYSSADLRQLQQRSSPSPSLSSSQHHDPRDLSKTQNVKELDEEDEEELDEVEVVPVGPREKTPKSISDDVALPDSDLAKISEEDPNDVGKTDTNLSPDDSEDDEYHPEPENQDVPDELHPQSVSSESSSLLKHGLSEISTVTTPTSVSVLTDNKGEIKTPIPSLLKGSLRAYQHFGLDWLANLYSNGTNGILADEMGLGKTIQTIALISHLAIEKEVWGPHLIVVPTSVILNWEMEFKKWAPAFRILTYYGSREVRQEKRRGWMNNDSWNVCITSYQLVVQDAQTFKRRQWHYLILDEAHNIKNFRSQRWQTLLNFKAQSRLLLTGTPLQNNLMELWSLLYFLMPSGSAMSRAMPAGFTSLKDFQESFKVPVDQLMEGGREGMDEESRDNIKKLHKILRPFLLRRLKKDVEKQMPGKYEHIVWCHLSKRQRFLYDEFMSRTQTRETLTSGNYLSIINCLMQLRKVCNHPDLFETRQIVTSFAMSRSVVADFEIQELFVRRRLLKSGAFDRVDLELLNLNYNYRSDYSLTLSDVTRHLSASSVIRGEVANLKQKLEVNPIFDINTIAGINAHIEHEIKRSEINRLEHMAYLNDLRTSKRPLWSKDLLDTCNRAFVNPISQSPPKSRLKLKNWLWQHSPLLSNMTLSVIDRTNDLNVVVQKFGCVTPAVVATDLPSIVATDIGMQVAKYFRPIDDPFHKAQNRLSIAFPDKRLLQYDCGKLQKLDELLRNLQAGGHRALIFTQMTKVLDILEQFLNIHGHRYLRLDGATKIEQRQILTERFNSDNRILVFILSSRSGGLGINLTGADSVIFYDLDWNPAMDKQCQDRCHRIGQTRDVHIYRFVSEFTIESNILRKSNQKQLLDDVVIQEGEFTVDKFNRLTVADLFGDEARKLGLDSVGGNLIGGGDMERALEQVEDADDVTAAKIAEKDNVEILDKEDFARENQAVIRKPTLTSQESTRLTTPTSEFAIPHIMEDAAPVSNVEEQQQDIATDEDEEQEEDEKMDESEEEVENEDFQSIDDYLLRLWVWELRNEPVIIPNKSKKKRSRKSKKS